METNPPESSKQEPRPERNTDAETAALTSPSTGHTLATGQNNQPAHGHHDAEVLSEARAKEYWAANVRLMLGLLVIWFAVSFGAGILFVGPLNQFSIGGFPLGFWFAQQGSIYVFVALIFFYSHRMRVIERTFGVDDDD